MRKGKADLIDSESSIVCRFKGNIGYGLSKGHNYLISIYRTIYGFQVEVKEDLTTGEECKKSIPFSSRGSIDANWVKCEE